MGLIKRAWLSIIRQQKKSLILFGVVFILGNVIAGSYAILQGNRNVERVIQDQLLPIVSLELDHMKWSKADREKTTIESLPPMPSAEDLRSFGELPYVKSYDITYRWCVYSDQLDACSNLSTIDSEPADSTENLFWLVGTEYAPGMMIEEKKASLVSGRTFTQSEIDEGQLVALVSKDLAERNQLDVGQSIIMHHDIVDWDETLSWWEVIESRPIVLRIIGVLDYVTSAHQQMDQLMDQLIVPNRVLDIEHRASMEAYIEQSNREYTEEETALWMIPTYHALYRMSDSSAIDQFVTEVEPLLPEYHTIKKTSDVYTRIAGPIKQADKIATQVFWGGNTSSIMILMLVILLFLRDRKYELAILLSLGEKRSKILVQIMLEIILVASIAILLSIVTGNLIIGTLSESMLRDQLIQEAQTTQVSVNPWADKESFGVFSADVSFDEVASRYQIALTPRYVGLLLLVSFGTILLSGTAPLVFIMHLSPKRIMT